MGVPRDGGARRDLGDREDGDVAIAGKLGLLQDRAGDARSALRWLRRLLGTGSSRLTVERWTPPPTPRTGSPKRDGAVGAITLADAESARVHEPVTA
jgi:hypothetical protein